jgi:hypothetical protein
MMRRLGSMVLSYLLGEDGQRVPRRPEWALMLPDIDRHLTSLVRYQNRDHAQLYLDRLARFERRWSDRPDRLVKLADILAERMQVPDLIGLTPVKREPGRIRVTLGECAAMLPVDTAMSALDLLDWLKWGHVAFAFDPQGQFGRMAVGTLAKLRRTRPLSLRYRREGAAIERWLHMITRSESLAPESVDAVLLSGAMVAGRGAAYQRRLADWHALIDQMIKPVLDGKLVCDDVTRAIAAAEDLSARSATTAEFAEELQRITSVYCRTASTSAQRVAA